MKTYHITSLLVSVLLAITIAGCAVSYAPPGMAYVPPVPVYGDIVQLSEGSTLWGLRQCLLGKPGTFIMQKDMAYVFTWSYRAGTRSFFALDLKSMQSLTAQLFINRGQLVSVETFDDFMEVTKLSGFKIIDPTLVSTEIGTTILTYAKLMSNSMVTVVILPGAFLSKNSQLIYGELTNE